MLSEYRKDLPYYVLSRGATVLSWILIVWLLTRVLEPNEYGEYSIIYAMLTFVSTCTSSWLNSSIYRHLPEFQSMDQVSLFKSVILRLALPTTGISVLLFTLILAGVSLGRVISATPQILSIVTVAFVCHTVFVLITTYLSASRMLREYAFAVAGQVGLYAIGIALFVRGGDHGLALIFAVLLASYLPAITLTLSRIRPQPVAVATYARDYLRYGLPLMIMSSATLVNMYGDQFLIRAFTSSTEVGLYSANYVFAERSVTSLTSLLLIAYVPILFRTWESGRHEDSYRFIWKIAYLLMATLLPVGVMLFLFGDSISSLVIGPSFTEGATIIPIVGTSAIVTSLAGVFADVMTVHKRTGMLAAIYAFSALVNIALNCILIPNFGYTSAAYATLMASIVLVVAVFIAAQKLGSILQYAR